MSSSLVVTEPAPSLLSSFVGTWQYGEPCTGTYHWIRLELAQTRLRGRWVAYNDDWGLDSGAISAAPAPEYAEDNQWGFTQADIGRVQREGFLELETCQDVSDLPRYAESRCPEIDSWPREWLKLDSEKDELMFVAPNFASHTRMRRVEESEAPPATCPPPSRGEGE